MRNKEEEWKKYECTDGTNIYVSTLEGGKVVIQGIDKYGFILWQKCAEEKE